MARLFITRMLETLFRRWYLFALPIVLLLGLGVFTILGAGTTYRSTGVLLVNRQSLQAELAAQGGGSDFGTDTPAAYTARQINTVLATDSFLDDLIDIAQIRGAIDDGTLTRAEVRKSVGAGEAGDDLVSVSATTSDPQLSLNLAQGTIDAYTQWQIGGIEISSSDAVRALDQQLTDQEARLEELESQGAGVEAIENQQTLIEQTRTNIEAARAIGEGSATEVNARLRPVDQPELPTSPTSSRKEDVQTLVLFLVLGTLVSAAALVVTTLLDRSVRYGEEIEIRLKLPVLATVPESPAARAPLVV